MGKGVIIYMRSHSSNKLDIVGRIKREKRNIQLQFHFCFPPFKLKKRKNTVLLVVNCPTQKKYPRHAKHLPISPQNDQNMQQCLDFVVIRIFEL